MKRKVAKKPAKRKPVVVEPAVRMVTFTPTRDLPLTLNGVTINVSAGVETTIPATYKSLYDNAMGG